MLVLGIETSCDETGVALYDSERGLLGDLLHSQVELHAQYGGVVPELASRDHVCKTTPLIEALLQHCDLDYVDLDGIAYTQGPGLVGALMVGAAVGASLAWSLEIPAIGVHHMEGHLLAPLLEARQPQFPFVALLVSGGHTQLVEVSGIGAYRMLGESLDDAAGEAFDKTAKMLGLPYPGGPALSRLAQQGNAERFSFPRPMTRQSGLDFSFSGLKTFALTTWREHQHQDDQLRADICRAFEDAVIDTLVIKCRRALEQTGGRQLVVAGGVSANARLRTRLDAALRELGGEAFYPRTAFCTDNGAMIAYAGWHRLQAGQHGGNAFQVRPRWPMEELEACCAESG